jgi:hypothetical protein
MATYLQGVQDKMEGIRPPQQNLQFDAQMLQTRQSKYDQNHNKLNDMYGQILNAGLTRGDNIQARDDFFKMIDSDIKKVSGMDLSLESNSKKAENLFSQVYDNNYLVKDMVWTKNFENQMKRSEAFKNCVDPAICGGEYWEDGVKAMQYHRQEFAESTGDESLSYQNAEYVPYNNVMDKALKDFKEMGGYDIQGPPQMSADGKYWVTTKNGKQSIKPLTAMFSKLYKDNPGLQKQFEVTSYNARKDWAAGQVQAGEFESMTDAEVGYIKQTAEALNQRVIDISEEVGADAEVIDKKLKSLQALKDSGKMIPDSKEHKQYQEYGALKQLSDEAKGFTDVAKSAMKNATNNQAVRGIGAQMDQASAVVLLNQEIGGAAEILAYKDHEVSIEADEFAKMKVKHGYDAALENLKSKNRMKEEANKKALGSSTYNTKNKLQPMLGREIEDFATKNIPKGDVAVWKKQAEAEFKEYYSSGDMTKLDADPNSDLRKQMLDTNLTETQKREAYVLHRKAYEIDKAYGTNYSNDLKQYGSMGFSGGGQPQGGYQQGGQGVNRPAAQPSYASIITTGADITGNHIELLAATHADPAKREEYQKVVALAKKQGVSTDDIVKKMNPKKRNELATHIGSDLDQAKAVADGDTWQKAMTTTIDIKKEYVKDGNISAVDAAGMVMDLTTGNSKGVIGKMYKVKPGRAEPMVNGDKPYIETKKVLAQTLSTEYLKALDESSDEFKQLQKAMETQLLTYGEVGSNGLTLTNKNGTMNFGNVYRHHGQRWQDGVGWKRYENKTSNAADKNLKLIVSGKEHSLDKKKMLEVLKMSPNLADGLFKGKIMNNISGDERGNFFSSTHETGGATLLSQYRENDAVAEIYREGKIEARKSVVSKMNSIMNEYDGGWISFDGITLGEGYKSEFANMKNPDGSLTYVADDFINKNGDWDPDYDTTTEETRKAFYDAYMESMDAVYVENASKYYMPGLGNRVANEMKLQRPDLRSTNKEGATFDVRNMLNEFSLSNVQADGAFRYNGKVNEDNNFKDQLINNMLEGNMNIETVKYTPYGGEAPNDAVRKQLTGDWQRMEVVDDKGDVYTFDLHNETHSQTTLLNKSRTTPKTDALNANGHYEYSEPDVLTNDKPLTIQRNSPTSIGVQGELWTWDDEQERAVYKSASNMLLDLGIDIADWSPEQIEPQLDVLVAQSLEEYKKHVTAVK